VLVAAGLASILGIALGLWSVYNFWRKPGQALGAAIGAVVLVGAAVGILDHLGR
jgi:hypothetical protein